MALRLVLSLGFITAFVGFVCMLWTESLVARHHVALDKHQPNIVKVNDCNVVDPTLNGSLVYIQGRLNVPIPIRLDEYKITVHAVKLKRRVQMYQWSELPKDRPDYLLDPLEDEIGGLEEVVLGADDVTYVKEWKSEIVNFTGKHASVLSDIIINPTYFPVTNHLFLAPQVKVGAYVLTDYFVENYFNHFKEITGDERPDDPNIKLHAGLYYHTANIWEPQIGDIRVRYAFAGNGGITLGQGTPVSIVAKQEGKYLYPYEDEHGRLMAIVHEDWDPLHEVIHLEKVIRSRPLLQKRLTAVGIFSLGCGILLIYAERFSFSAVLTCVMLSFGVCWMFHWTYHAIFLVLFAFAHYHLVVNQPEEHPQSQAQKRRNPSS
jgi:hypothetical protein